MAGALKETNSGQPSLSEMGRKYVSNAMELIHAPENKDKFISMLKQSLETGNNGDALADAILTLSSQLDSVAQSQGIQIGHEVKFETLPYLVDQVVEVATSYKMIPELGEQDLRMLISTIVVKYIESSLQKGTLTKEEMAQAGTQMQQEQARAQAGAPTEEEM